MSEFNKHGLPAYFLLNFFGKNNSHFFKNVTRMGVAPAVVFANASAKERSELSQISAPVAVYIDQVIDGLTFLQNPFVYCVAKAGLSFIERPANLLYEIHSEEEAAFAISQGATGLIVKGNEAAGAIGSDATFILFQKIFSQFKLPIWLRGGIGFHNAAAAMALGAQGVVLEEVCYLFPELGVPAEFQTLFSRLDGTETRELFGQRCLLNIPFWPKQSSKTNIDEAFFRASLQQPLSPENPLIPIGQAIGLASAAKTQFKTLENFISKLKWSLESHLHQANNIARNTRNARRFHQDLGLTYPIAQGPMTRVSDAPEFINAVAQEGALPFFALAMLKGSEAEHLLEKTRTLLADKPWGVGVLGFIDAHLQQEQFNYIRTVKPPFVLVAGGNSGHVKRYADIGATVFLHTPSVALLDTFLKEDLRHFVFEGRECGGHVGPLSSFVLWEKSVSRLLQEQHLEHITCYFAGGIHDSLSAAFVNIMAAPLVARGAKVGLLMGTSYLYTKEAVSDGAILAEYQQRCVNKAHTTLLESSPGHVVRCLQTPFAEFFNTTKSRLLGSTQDSRQVAEELEALNVGRLRLASKGLKRTDQGLERSSAAEQYQDGLYMVGQVATLPQQTKTIAELHQQVTAGADVIVQQAYLRRAADSAATDTGGIAIIGMSCILPEAQNLSQYWKNILENRNSITEVPRERWDSNSFFDPDAKKGVKSNSKWGGFIPATEFDPTEFGIPPQSLAAIDPAQLISLQATKDALVDAGYWKNERLDRENTAVIFGTEGGSELLLGYELRATLPRLFGELPDAFNDVLPSLTEDSFSGTLPNVISGRIANRLDFGARNFVVDAACASSLAAVDIACQELKNHRANVVVAGAVDLHNDLIDYLKFSSVGALSNEGLCKSFSEDASGIALGEGVGVLILKRVDDAIRDNDRIYAVIKGVGASSDGKSLGLTAPRKHGQMMAYERAYQEADINPLNVGLVEAHGTGTVVGDKVELESLSEFFGAAGAGDKAISLGSVKTQIGHTKCAAGLAAVIKTALSVYHGIKPATLHLTHPNKAYDETRSPFEFQQQAAIWTDARRVAGVSAFGFGGTNFHLVLENIQRSAPADITRDLWPSELFVLRASDETALVKQISDLLFLLEKESDLRLCDLAYTLATQSDLPIQWVLVAGNHVELIEKLRLVRNQKAGEGVYQVSAIAGKTAFLFSGQGSQRVDMARDLFVAFPQMRTIFNDYPELQQILFPTRTFDSTQLQQQRKRINRTENAQPLLGMVDLAIARLLHSFGVIPEQLAGHSYGEIPALVFAGVIDAQNLVSISQARAQSILDAVTDDAGAMLALNIDRNRLDMLIQQFPAIFIANHNTHTQWVVAGTTAAINAFMVHLDSIGQAYKQLPVACAFHSPVIAAAQASFSNALAHYSFEPANLPVWSNTTAAVYPENAGDIKARLSEHLVQPVKFVDQIQAMYDSGTRIFIETGPGRILANITRDILGDTAKTLFSIGENGQGLNQLVDMLAQYLATGKSLDFETLFAGRNIRRIDLSARRAQRKSNVLWLLRGNRADPVFMAPPAHASREIREPIALPSANTGLPSTAQTLHLSSTIAGNSVKEQMILEYLANMRAMIEAQQKVMLSYFNNGQIPPVISQSDMQPAPVQPRYLGQTVLNSEPRFATAAHNIAQTVIAQTVTSVAAPAAANAVITGQPAINVSAAVLKIICDKTGYPAEMLELDMDLEADLSIDSIKRTEIVSALKTQFSNSFASAANPENLVQHLSTMKTIRELISCFETQTAAGVKAAPALTATVEVNSAAATKATFSFVELLVNIVSERTGYPHDMLSMDMDLEADLSIDSIKRTEIISAVKASLAAAGIHTDEQALVKAAQGKTLGEIANLIGNGTAAAGDIPSKKPHAVADSVDDEEVHRYQFKWVADNTYVADNRVSLTDKSIGVFNDGSACCAYVCNALEAQGARVEKLSAAPKDLSHLDGFIHIDLHTSQYRLQPGELFALTKTLDANRLTWFFCVNDVNQRLDHYTQPRDILKQLCGTYGFINSLNKEWRAICRDISVADESHEAVASDVLREFVHTQKQQTVVHYRNGQRFINALTAAPWNVSAQPNVQLHVNDVVLVMGGAQGITAEIIQHMAAQVPCHYVLAGRTSAPEFSVDGVSDNELSRSIAEIKIELLRTEKFSSPKALETRAAQRYKHNQILLTQRRLEATGARVTYVAADLTNHTELTALIQRIKQDFGKLDGIIHASGHLEDKLTVDKTQASFDRVFATKLAPMEILVNEFQPSLKYCVLFSSVTSVFGNKGQIDYGTANAVFDQFANAVSKHPGTKHSGTKTIAINWGPWKGKGMIDQSLEQDFIRRGVKLIPLTAGAEAFLNELLYGAGGQAILMMPVADISQAKEQF